MPACLKIYLVKAIHNAWFKFILNYKFSLPLFRFNIRIPQKAPSKWVSAFPNLSNIIFSFTLTCLSCPLKSTNNQCVVVCLRGYAEVIVVCIGSEIVVGGLHVNPQLVEIVYTEKMVQVLVTQPMLTSQLPEASTVVSPVTIEIYCSIHSSLEYLHTAIRNVL